MLITSINTPNDTAQFNRQVTLIPALLRGLPMCSQAEADTGYGFGVDFNYRSVLTAHYESIERFLSETEKPYKKIRKSISDLDDQNFALSTIHCLKQTQTDSQNDLEEYQFSVIPCLEITTGRRIEAPEIMTNLSWADGDGVYLPVRDTSGSACHSDAEACFKNALLEFIERQCLCINWLSKSPKRRILLQNSEKLSSTSRSILDYLSLGGETRILDISGVFSAHTVLSVFTSHSPYRPVQYACGLACALNAETALKKSIKELYQGFMHMEYLTDNPPDQSNYLDVDYVNSNNCMTADLHGAGPNISVDEFLTEKEYTLPEAVSSLAEISNNIGYHQAFHQINGKGFTFGRVFSPDLFIHMSLYRNCNLDNPASQRMGLDLSHATVPIPFG